MKKETKITNTIKEVKEAEKLIKLTKNGLAGECPESQLKLWESNGWSKN